MDSKFSNLTIETAGAGFRAGDFAPTDLANFYLTRIKAKNSDLNAYLEVYDDVLAQAEQVTKILKQNSDSKLAGIPLAIKDNILIDGKIASAGSKMLANYVAVYDATVIKKLKQAGAIFLGRANMDEFAMGGSTENSAFGPTGNPFDKTRVAGGSSGGSAAAVGANLALAALGSDTGGSIRQPASFCGVVGLKPTYGTVSRYGVVAMASSLDQIGPLTKTVADAELVYRVISGRDEKDSTTIDPQVMVVPEKMTIGVPYDFLASGVDPVVLANFNLVLDQLKKTGHTVKEVSLPNLKYSLASYYVLMPAESSTNLGRFDGLRYGALQEGKNLLEEYMNSRGVGFGPEVRRRIILGTYVLSAGYYDAYYGKATAVRELIRGDYVKAFSKDGAGVDVIMTPTAPTPAFKIGEKVDDPLQMYLEDIFTVPANLAGVPALAVPSGKTDSGLPLGVQITGPHFGEDILFALGREIETII
ncbi:MAG: glutaminyl-tRNA synthase (glutamine-hydrolyzing) subunit A [Candidatus Vogelbacteria bacterium RIFOXYD1_FULL_44_32]|uniref:Glutamyl-tRNA(Gln) amidotransferase subunit A n=1 Tax=Candidatus Vogelbacteria bacterium RIFOXYD1_FULL_44_32 TaxID=1802438 RepID=A0A1G2QE24_9BACT|nr:MAG: glutaminyl-tRNA synthase (glutamine-hydrolyzing) subunit A [Candidatus Vogelbacteria bacterium RIFOXYD1_FULL_44_32]